jgi:adenylate cyclase
MQKLPTLHQLIGAASRIGADPDDSSDIALQKRVLVGLALIPAPAGIIWGVIYIAAGARLGGFIPAAYTFVVLANTALFGWTRNVRFFRFSQLLMILVLPWLMMLSLGGFKNSSVVIVWSVLSPLVVILIEDLRRARKWLYAFVALLVVSGFLQPYLSPVPLPELFVTWFFVLNLGVVIALGFSFLYYFVGQRNYFQQRSEMLLLNILPKEISEMLKAGPRTIAAQHDAASILFADVVEFTPLAATMTPLELVDLLNEVFQCFDTLVEKYDLEKIKTIGDCYMVASGVPRPRPDHATALVELALDMREAVSERSFHGQRLAFRIGINSGPVVAGVIGHKKFIYDLWGDAVNLASRMESHGEGGAIQITRRTYELIKNDFVCAEKGRIEVKGAGDLEVWHVTGRLSS